MTINNLHSLMTDTRILSELGERLTARRIDMGLTQAALARQAGVSKRTVERLENGESTQTQSLIRIMRALELLAALDALLPDSRPRPMDLLKRAGRRRQRVSQSAEGKAADSAELWTWEDET